MVHENGEGRIDEVLDQQAWLMRLARKLGRDESAAEELAQDSLIAAWAHPPRERGGALRAWLRSVLVHRARTDATAERRRREREVRSARPEAVAAADEIAERLELARRVALALDELPEAERRALYLRYYEELSPPEIARAVGAPLGTVKSRLAQGRERLRRELDRTYGERGAWLVLLAPLGAAPLPVPTHPAAALAAAGSTGPALIGALTMASKTTLALAAAAVLGVSLLVWKPWEHKAEVAEAAPDRRGIELAGVERDLHPPIGESLDASSTQRVELPTEAFASSNGEETTTGRVEIVATYASDGSPAANLYGFLAHEHDAWRGDEAPSAHRFLLDSAGRATVDVESGAWIARLNGREVEGDALSIAAGESATAKLAIQAGLMVRGRVLDDQEAPVSGAEVFLAREGDQPGIGTLALADAGGGFSLRDIAPWGQSGPYTELAARSAGRVTSRSVEAMGRVGDVLEIVLRLEGVGGRVRGRVVDSSRNPVASARIEFPYGPWLSNSGTSAEGLSLSAQPKLELATDSDGRFESDRLPEGYVTLTVSTDEHPVWAKQLAIQPGATTDVEVQLEDGGALEGTVVDAEGKPADRARVWAGWPGRDDGFRKAQTDASGHYRITGLDAGRAEVHATTGFGKEARAEVTIVAGETTRWDVSLLRSERASGFLLDEAGAPLEGWGVHVIKPDRKGLWYVSASADASGHFVLDNCPEGPKALEVRLPEPFAAPPLLFAPFPENDEEVTLVVPNRARPSATLSGRFADPSGADLEGLEVWLNAGESNWGKQILPDRATQAFTFGPMMAGSYRLNVNAKGYVSRTIEVADLAPGEMRDLGAIELQRGSLLAIKFIGEVGEARDKVLQLIGPDGSISFTEHVEMPSWRSEPLAPGTWTLRTAGDSMALHESVVQLVPGQTTELTIEIVPGASRHFEVGPLDDGEEFSIEVFAEDGRRFEGPSYVFTTQAVVYGLTPGKCRVVARSSSGRSGEVEFTIDSLDFNYDLIKILLR